MKKIVYTLFIFLLSNLAYSQVAGTDDSWSFYPDGYVIYNNDGSINRYHAKLQFSGSNQNIVTDLLWDQLPCGGANAKKVWWINEDHSGDQNYYGFQTSRPENIVHEFGGDFTYHCGCTTTNPNDWNLYGSPQGFTNIIEVPYHIRKFDVDSPNYIIKPSTFHWNKNSLEVQTFKGGLIPPIGAGTIEQYGKINLHTGMLPKSITDHNTVMSYGLSYLNAKNMPNLPLNKRYVTANDGEWATNWNNCNSTLPYPQAGCIAGYQFNHMTTQQAWDTYGTNLSSKSNYGVVLQDGEFWNGNIDSQGLTNYKYVFDRVIQNGSTTLFGQHHSQPYYTDRFFHDPSGGTDPALWNAKYTVSAADRYSLVSFNYISAYWQKVIANNTSVADDWKIASLQTYTQDLSPTNMYAWIQDLEINKKLFPEWKHLLTVEGFHETPYFATVSHTIPTGGAITFTGGQSQWVKQSSSLQEFTGLYSNTIGDGVCYFSDNYTRNDDKSNWIKEDGNTQYPGADVYARQFYGVDDYLYLGIWKANEVNRQTVGQTWSKPDISVDGGSTWITETALLPASAYSAKHPLVHIINMTAGGKIIMAYNMWNPAYKVQTIKVRDASGVISDVQLKGQFPTLYKYGEASGNYLSVSPATWSAPAAGGSTTASLSASGAWSIPTVPAWLTVSPTSGNGSATLTLTAAANTATNRTAPLTINGPAGTTQSITVTQAGITNSLSVSPANWSASTSGSSQLITVTSNVDWSVNTNGTSWLSVNTASSSNNGTFTLTAAANSGSARSATLSVTGGGLTQTITVTQQGSTPSTEVICLEAESGSGNRTPISGSQASAGQYVGGFGVSAEFMSYSFSVPTAGTYPLHLWYASGESPQFGIMVNGVLQTASAVGTNSWSGPFVETTVSVNLGAGVNTIQLQGTSAGHGFALDKLCINTGTTPNNLTVDQTTVVNVASTGGSQLITVTSNVAWSVNNNGTNWLSVNAASGSNNGTFTLTAAANSGSARSATLSVTGGGLTQTITVTQQGSTPSTEVICLEAESGSGNRTPISGSQASAGQYVGGFGVSAEFMSYSFSVPTAGTYPLHLWYASGESPQFGIMVNGVLQTASAVGTNSWSGPFVETTVSVNLGAGVNTIQLQGTSAGHGFALDKLCINTGTTSTTVTGSNCGNTPQNYCWTGAIPAGQVMFRTAAVEVVAGPKSANDSGNPPASGNCWCIQQYAGQPNCYIYPTSTKDMLLPVTNTPTATQYRVTVGTGQTGKTAKLYVNGTLTWSKTVTDWELLYPDFTSVTAQSRLYFVIESGSARMGEGYVEKFEENLATVVYPNPTVDVVKVVYYLVAAETVQYSLINTEGKLLLNKLANGTAGQNQLEIDMKANPSGVYFLRLQSTQKNETIKVIRGK